MLKLSGAGSCGRERNLTDWGQDRVISLVISFVLDGRIHGRINGGVYCYVFPLLLLPGRRQMELCMKKRMVGGRGQAIE